MDIHTCIRCKGTFWTDEMTRKGRSDGSPRYSYCRGCEAERNKEWRQHNREYYNKSQNLRKKVAEAMNPGTNAARMRALRAYPDKQPCEVCGDSNGQRHHRDYSEPLEIVWLCQTCHTRLHYHEGGVKSATTVH